ncbi:hypothetical protein Wildcat_16 [Mycobacterium phage Wildcat]|uniref:Uncharacterized protein n=4 Tax=Mycobacterium virus Wildcat TaxID=1993859 RepID=Q19Y44_9CAUD|nr:hypothetical protein Wildcat_16 [Mycobacterium phage Wildcat]AJD82088.1 hypothetical protein COSMO_16 [Mycobacterium phage Cosmo]AQT25688.1 hypothetical protein EniyanLRS_13 [Mycobacterium phage EniyanLRS]QGJ89906.1 hypothetical protein PBI_MARYV_16 [Mycobacterium phage MaryV]WKR36025.1 hypothetical protein [Mycobacterium phage Azrael100]ABE67621.1 hypothetical protein Wildcat_16 [Mycobacterium phage Wildcat]
MSADRLLTKIPMTQAPDTETVRKARNAVALNVPKEEVAQILDMLGLLDD